MDKKRVLGLVLSLALVVGGVLLFRWSAPKAPVPDPPKPDVSVSADVPPVGPSEAPASSGPSEEAKVMGSQDMEPYHILIPSLGVYAKMDVKGTNNGYLVLSPDPWILTVWSGSAPVEADTGATVLAGHSMFDGRDGALRWLANVEPGNLVYTMGLDRKVQTFKVTERKNYYKESIRALSEGWLGDDSRRVVLVTCGGDFIPLGNGQYGFTENTVVVAVPA